jgi:hypothetical protein
MVEFYDQIVDRQYSIANSVGSDLRLLQRENMLRALAALDCNAAEVVD